MAHFHPFSTSFRIRHDATGNFFGVMSDAEMIVDCVSLFSRENTCAARTEEVITTILGGWRRFHLRREPIGLFTISLGRNEMDNLASPEEGHLVEKSQGVLVLGSSR